MCIRDRFILAIVGCSSNESHSFLIRPDGGGEDATTEIEVGKTIPAHNNSSGESAMMDDSMNVWLSLIHI